MFRVTLWKGTGFSRAVQTLFIDRALAPVVAYIHGCFLEGNNLPLKPSKFSQPAEVALIGCHHFDPQPSGAHGNQGIVGQPSLPNSFVVILRSQSIQHSPRMNPVIKIWNQNSLRSIKIPLQSLDSVTITIA